jgi:hypothetical protein
MEYIYLACPPPPTNYLQTSPYDNNLSQARIDDTMVTTRPAAKRLAEHESSRKKAKVARKDPGEYSKDVPAEEAT